MSFGGFGTKPATTGVFGSTQPQQQTGSLFGAPQTAGTQTGTPLFGQPQQQQQQQQQQQPAAGGSLFGNTQTQQPQAGGSVFGSTQQPAQSTGGLFGNTTAQQQPAQGGLFGSTTNQPAQGGGLFGTQQPAQQQQGGSLFGGTQQPAQQQGISLFGNAQQPATGQTSSLFGTTQQQPVIGTPLFGNTQQPQTGSLLLGNIQPSLFGSTSATTQSQQQSSVLGTTFGTKPLISQPTLTDTATCQTEPAYTNLDGPLSKAPLFTKSTKFNDLPDSIKKVFEDIDSHIQGRVHIGKELKQRKLSEQATKGKELTRDVYKELANATSTLRADVHSTKDLKTKADQCVQDTIVAIRILDGHRNAQNGAYLKNHATFPLEFFDRITVQMRERLHWYKTTIEQIERKLASASAQTQYTPQSITSTLQTQHATFVALANKTATIDAELQKIKTLYTQLWRARTGSMRDPFNELDRGTGKDFGLEGLSV